MTTMVPFTLSPSRMSDFKICPQLFKFRAIDRLPEPPSEPALRGTAVHQVLQRLFCLPPLDRTRAAAAILFDETWGTLIGAETRLVLFTGEHTEASSREQALGYIDHYFDIEDPTTVEPIGLELRLRSEIGNLRVQGILDRLDRRDNDTWVISDYKTGRTPELARSQSAFFGLHIYAALLADLVGRPPARLRLMYLDSSEVYAVDVTERDIDHTRRMVTAIAAAIARSLACAQWSAKPKGFCKACAFTEVCPAWQQSPPQQSAKAQQLEISC